MSEMKCIEINRNVPLAGAVIYDGLVYVSGQVGFKPGTTQLDPDFADQCDQTMANIDAILEKAGTSKRHIIRCGVYLPEVKRDFAKMNERYANWLGDHRPARTTCGAQLAGSNILVEIDCIAKLPD